MQHLVFAVIGVWLAGTAFGQEWQATVGQDAILSNPQGGSVYVAFGSPAWSELVAAIKANDKVGIDQLIEEKRAALVSNGTGVLILKEFETKQGVGFNGVRSVTVTYATSWEIRIKDGDQ